MADEQQIDPDNDHVEAEEQDVDSALGDDMSTLTQSVRSSIFQGRYENGRRYHVYKDGKYFMPEDEIEQERMDMQHHAIITTLGRHFLSPVENPGRILDLGCGTGIWAIQVADENPNAEVFGVDLSPMQPGWVPPNVKFEIDDVEDTWTWPDDHFSLIFSRLMISGSIQNLAKYTQQVFRHLSPGGYFESQEVQIRLGNDIRNIPEEDPLALWCKYMRDGIERMGRSLAPDLDNIGVEMRNAGFVDVVVRPFKLPLGTWPKDKRLKQGGSAQLVALYQGLQSISLALFTRCLGWSPEEVEVFLAQVRNDMIAKSRQGFYFYRYVKTISFHPTCQNG
ncbi:hypothetical protein Z517_01032 [Fonsecaea pedrosoi CBS 271.37]|uniref:Methyltransferase domain-containing protein n=1 Tax=Fonsecaea pedrosoi CBS 271.37 TaxID=1442368 RepID=A0A0D2H421_9EURO|nr:uncharacterized protein Z517_01032 [Fonsecaea pedrosoi CBS 271.37]KIW85640.1 hypothetical protein Z517_01032 [Fonsecaea pedrosoi CBS 271.37]